MANRLSFIWVSWLTVAVTWRSAYTQGSARKVGGLEEVFAWKQLTYEINGNIVLQDRIGGDGNENSSRNKRQSDSVLFLNDEDSWNKTWNQSPTTSTYQQSKYLNRNPTQQSSIIDKVNFPTQKPANNNSAQSTVTSNDPSTERGSFFIQYNNIPMGAERHGQRLFITVPRRRYGIPATLNYIDISRDSNTRSPHLRPYPNLAASRSIISVYRTRVDICNRLWMIDTGLLEIPNARQQVKPPAIVVYDLNTDTQILTYQLKESDLPGENTPAGLASITVDVLGGDCANAFAYIPDLATYGLIVYSMRDNDSWRVTHNYFHFNPLRGNLNIANQKFQWNDGIFSIVLSSPSKDGCRTAYFHPMASTEEFSVSTCVLKNRTASAASNYYENYSIVGTRGDDSQSTMHDLHEGSKVVFFAEIARNAVSCWRESSALTQRDIAVVAQDSETLIYPADLHVTGDEVWVLANSLPKFIYSRLDPNEYNFYVYRAKVRDLISNTVCEGRNKNY